VLSLHKEDGAGTDTKIQRLNVNAGGRKVHSSNGDISVKYPKGAYDFGWEK